MLYNYLKVIIRNFISDGMYSFIIVFGLAIGLASSLMIAQYIHFEMSFDKQYKNAEDIYYTYLRWKGEKDEFDIDCHAAVAPLFDSSVPEVESIARMVPIGINKGSEWTIRKVDANGMIESFSREKDLFFADASILDIFSIPLLQGNLKTALQEPNTAVLSQKLADKLFPKGDALNQSLQAQVRGKLITFRIDGITVTPSNNSSIQFNALFSLKSIAYKYGSLDNNWDNPVFKTYTKLHHGTDPNAALLKINKTAEEPFSKREAINNFKQSVRFHPFRDFHFFQNYRTRYNSRVHFTGDKNMINYFAFLAFLILIISWANYINLTTARALRRAKEVGLRKVNGAKRKDLVWQFLLEFFSMNLISLLLAFTLAQLFFGTFAQAIGSSAEWVLWREPIFWLIITIFLAISTLASGIYPAFILSSYSPSKVLKGSFSRSQSGVGVRKGLVVIQFALSIFLLTSIYVIVHQLSHMQNKELGQSSDQVLVIRMVDIDTAISKTDAYLRWKTKLSQHSFVKSTAAANTYPGERFAFQFYSRSDATDDKNYGLQTNSVSENFLKTMGITLLYGRDFNDDMPGEVDKIIINKKAAAELGLTDLESIVGEKITNHQEDKVYEIIGVVNDFMVSQKTPSFSESFKYQFWINQEANYYNYLLVKLETKDIRGSIEQLQSDWNVLFNNSPFDCFFLDKFFNAFYKDEQQFAGVFGFFSFIGIAITCMGLFGLSLYNTNSRAKEIGIRKTLGGSASNIMWLFSKDYLKLIIIAAIISSPIGIWALNNWLKSYPERITLNVLVALIPALVTILIAMVTVGYHTFKTAYMNPVKSLRAE